MGIFQRSTIYNAKHVLIKKYHLIQNSIIIN